MTAAGVLAATSGLVERGADVAVRVAGPDAHGFLDSLISQELAGVGDGEGIRSLLLQPTGKMGIDFRLLVVGAGQGDEFWLDTEPGWGTALAEGLRRFLIRMQVDVTERGSEWSLASVRGEGAPELVARALEIEVPQHQHGHEAWEGARIVRADWPGARGVDFVGPAESVQAAAAAVVAAGGARASLPEWDAARIDNGIPRLGVDLDESVIPQEARLDEVAVSFSKGCFLGQELVCRIRDRGHVNRLLRRLRIDGPTPPPAGAEILAGERTVGAVTSSAGPPTLAGVVALAFVKIDVEPGDAVTVRWPAGTADAVVEEVAPVA